MATSTSSPGSAPPPIVVDCRTADLNALLAKEWLLANSLGAYASSTVVGCNARRYHGLLVAATMPPVGRIVALSTVMEQVTIGGTKYELATNEFADTFSPRGSTLLAEFRNDAAAMFIYRAGGAEILKEVLLADAANAVAIRYTIKGGPATIDLWPFASMRDYHGLRKASEPHQMTFQSTLGGISIQDRMLSQQALFLSAGDGPFTPRPQWWYRFCYRIDIARGQDGFEDLYTPGCFTCALEEGRPVQLTASLRDPIRVDFPTMLDRRRKRMADLAASVAAKGDETSQRLAMATDAFVVQRHFPGSPPSLTVVAGYPWFADWGRDAFIALPGLLLCTGRFEQARAVFRTFAGSISQGLIPNRFDDYATSAHYNSIDASLWFIVAAERYVAATGDRDFWRETLMPAADAILTAYQNGTMFDIRADADGLLTGGSRGTQLTWMDAKLGDEVITPRHGKAVEVNALWHCAHRIMADRCRGIDNAMAARYAHAADLIGPVFVKTFWHEQLGWLHDCISDNWPDASLRPNQILAVSLPHCPLDAAKQAAIVRIITEKLLTPRGLRTLSPDDSRYRRRYGGSWESRDRAYHQGTVWAWLIGPFIEAYLKVEGGKPFAVAQARKWLEPFDQTLHEAGIGYISEIFDGDAPHRPNGCIAQAWSVAEVLRAKMLVAAAQ
ncbi:MAG: amylo-alpha-1,6-glucosidase [Phycisphaerae bacterium]